jgi:hypothetical protein
MLYKHQGIAGPGGLGLGIRGLWHEDWPWAWASGWMVMMGNDSLAFLCLRGSLYRASGLCPCGPICYSRTPLSRWPLLFSAYLSLLTAKPSSSSPLPGSCQCGSKQWNILVSEDLPVHSLLFSTLSFRWQKLGIIRIAIPKTFPKVHGNSVKEWSITQRELIMSNPNWEQVLSVSHKIITPKTQSP